LEAQQVAPAGQISDRVSLDEELVLLVHERGEGDQVECAVGCDEQVTACADESAHRAHHGFVERAGECFHVRAGRVDERRAPVCDRRINRRGDAQIDPARCARVL
jgi:hypothetical protein